MTRNLKVLGLALVAVLAMSAVAASAAQALKFESTGGYPARVTAGQEGSHSFTAAGATITCSTVSFSGEASGASETLTITPIYTGCSGAFGANAKITGFGHYGAADKGCDYLLRANGTVDLVCEPGKQIVIDTDACTVTIPAQPNLGTITFDHEGAGTTTDEKLTINVSKIKYTVHASPGDFACTLITSGPYGSERADGTYKGTSTATGEKTTSTEHTGIKVA